MSKINNMIQKITQWKVILAIQFIASVILLVFIFKLGALPMLFIIGSIVILLLLFLISFSLMKPSKKVGKGKIRSILGKMLSLVLSILLLIGSLYVIQSDSVLAAITGANTQTTRFCVYVLDESEYESLSDLSGEVVEVNFSYDDSDKFNEALEALNDANSDIQTQTSDDYASLADDLYNSNVAAIYVNEAYNNMFEENYPDFESETRIIWTYEIVEEISDISKNVNVTEETFTIYISGIDTTGPVSTVSRSDVNMLVTVNPNTKQILLTSIPRDYYVTLANKNQKDKLTHAGLAGVQNSVETIENFMDIDINYYVRVNFTSLIEIVDALGGITVYSPVAFTTRHGNYSIVKGDNQMDGAKALAFVRERYSLSGGDNDRIKNQQRVLAAMLEKAMSSAIITNYSSILKSIEESFETNMSSSEITSLIQMQLNDMASWEILQVQLTGTGTTMTGGAYMPDSALYYMIPDQSSVDSCSSLIKKMVNGETISVSE